MIILLPCNRFDPPVSARLKEDASNIAGVLASLSVERQKEIEDILTQYASRLPERDIHRVYAEKVGKLGKDAMLYCDEKWGESGEIFTVDARAMSDGTRHCRQTFHPRFD